MFAFDGHYASATRAMAYVCTTDKLAAAFERPHSHPLNAHACIMALSPFFFLSLALSNLNDVH